MLASLLRKYRDVATVGERRRMRLLVFAAIELEQMAMRMDVRLRQMREEVKGMPPRGAPPPFLRIGEQVEN